MVADRTLGSQRYRTGEVAAQVRAIRTPVRSARHLYTVAPEPVPKFDAIGFAVWRFPALSTFLSYADVRGVSPCFAA